jgi:hypothetical protein
LSEFPDAGESATPRMMSVVGDLIFYRKGDATKDRGLRSRLAAVRQIHAFAPEVKGILDAWFKAMTGVLR